MLIHLSFIYFGFALFHNQVLVKGILDSGLIEEALRKGALIREGLSSSTRPTPPNQNSSDFISMQDIKEGPEMGGVGRLETDEVRNRSAVGRREGGEKEASSRKVLSIREDGAVEMVGVEAMPPMPAPSL